MIITADGKAQHLSGPDHTGTRSGKNPGGLGRALRVAPGCIAAALPVSET
jgi:hypothetical protein